MQLTTARGRSLLECDAQEEDSSDSDEDDSCPLCTEELDLTDQAAELCQCGYKICLWCYNQILENAAKENAEGRCPACRTVYNPEKMAMAEIDQDLLAESKKKEDR